MAEQGTPDVSGTPLSIPAGNLSSMQLQSMLESFLAPIGEKMTSIDNTIRETKELTVEQLAELSSINSIISDIKDDIKTTEKNTKDIRNEFVAGGFKQTMSNAVAAGMKKSNKFTTGLSNKVLKTHFDKLSKNITNSFMKMNTSQPLSGADKFLDAIDSLVNKIEKISNPDQKDIIKKSNLDSKDFDFDVMKIESEDILKKNVIDNINEARKSLIKLMAEGLDESKAKNLNTALSNISQTQIKGNAQLIQQLKNINNLQAKINNQQKNINTNSLKYINNMTKAVAGLQKLASMVGIISYGAMFDNVKELEHVLQRSSVSMYGIASEQNNMDKMLESQATSVREISGSIISNLQAAKGQNLLFKQGIKDFGQQGEILKASALSAQEMGVSFEELVEYAGDMSYDLRMSGRQTRYLIRGVSNISKQFGLSAKQVKEIQSGMKDTLKNIRDIRGASATATNAITKMRAAIEKERGNVKLIDDINAAFTGGIENWGERILDLGVVGSYMIDELRKVGSTSEMWHAGTTNAEDLNKAFFMTTKRMVEEIKKLDDEGWSYENINIYMMSKFKMGVQGIYNTHKAAANAMESTTEGAIDALERYKNDIENIKIHKDILGLDNANALIASIQEKMNIVKDSITVDFSTALSDISSVLTSRLLNDIDNTQLKFLLQGDASKQLDKSIKHFIDNQDLIPEDINIEDLKSLQQELKGTISDDKIPELLRKIQEVTIKTSEISDKRAEDLNKMSIQNAKDAINVGHNRATAIFQHVTLGALELITNKLGSIALWGSLFLSPMLMLLNLLVSINTLKDLFGGRTIRPFGGRTIRPFGGRTTSPFGGRTTSPFGGRTTSPFGGRTTNPFGGRTTNPFGGTIKNTISRFFGNIFGKSGIFAKAFGVVKPIVIGFFGSIFSNTGLFAKAFSFIKPIIAAGKSIGLIGGIKIIAAATGLYQFFKGFYNAADILGKAEKDLNIGDRLTAGFVRLSESIGNLISPEMGELFKNSALEGFKFWQEKVSDMFLWIYDTWQSLWDSAKEKWNSVKDTVSFAKEWTSDKVSGTKDWISDKIGFAKEWTSDKAANIKTGFFNIWDKVEGWASDNNSRPTTSTNPLSIIQEAQSEAAKKQTIQEPKPLLEDQLAKNLAEQYSASKLYMDPLLSFGNQLLGMVYTSDTNDNTIDTNDNTIDTGNRSSAVAKIPGIGQSQLDTKRESDDTISISQDNLSESQLAALNNIGSRSSDMIKILQHIDHALSASKPNYNNRSIPGVSASHKTSAAATFTSTEGNYHLRDAPWQHNVANASGGSNELMATS